MGYINSYMNSCVQFTILTTVCLIQSIWPYMIKCCNYCTYLIKCNFNIIINNIYIYVMNGQKDIAIIRY